MKSIALVGGLLFGSIFAPQLAHGQKQEVPPEPKAPQSFDQIGPEHGHLMIFPKIVVTLGVKP